MAKGILKVPGFDIIKRIGVGARSTIYLAIDQQDQKEVALKRVLYEDPQDARIFEQCETEFKVANKIDHPYVRKCYKLRKSRLMFRTRELIMSMEYGEGKTLEDSPSLSLVDVLLVFRMVASGLNAMHQEGYVHCDVKPNNILLSGTGAIKIIDLGQSCKSGTTKQRIQGTPDYIAPEQVKRKPINPRTDVFNLGATMYWALTGQNVPTLIPKKDKFGLTVPQQRKTPREIKSQIPESVSKLVMDCCENEPKDRPDGMLTVISRLDIIVHNLLGDKLNNKK
ncbi:MAG: serine/threonine protein kinase [Sedimentisphaerales bacterium]|nr:serine/threonine protein kinase [Sedimentisphaerales bacterium]